MLNLTDRKRIGMNENILPKRWDVSHAFAFTV